MSSSKIFVGYRALGFVSNHVPLAVRYENRSRENYVVTSVGKSFHTYKCSNLGIIGISDSHPDDITCLAVDSYLVFTACGKTIRAFLRRRTVEYSYEGHENDVILLLPFVKHLISVDEGSCLKVWDIRSCELYTELTFDPSSFQITALVHPATYLNKVLIGSKQGSLQLWNLKSGNLLYTFTGWFSTVTVLEQAPAIDVVAVGLASGAIVVHNIKYDETVMKFCQDWGPVTALTFRTDGFPILASGSTVGNIALWDLEERRLASQITEAHTAAVTGMKCLPSEPLMVTSAGDNSLKVWIFDLPDGGARVLRHREGHSAPPNKIRFHGNNGHNILSAGQDSVLRSFSTVHDSRNKSLGRASMNKKASKKQGLKLDAYRLPPITDFHSETAKESDWDNIVACHRNMAVCTTWSYQRCTMGQHKLMHERFKESEKTATATVVTVTSCGNFCILGYSSGHVDCYNMQSGIHRGSYGNPKGHQGAVRGAAVDNLNQVAVTAGSDKLVKFWRFKSKELLDSLKLSAVVSRTCLHRESSMLAVALDNFSVNIVDVDIRRIVREFSGHAGSITDMTFTPDARWLITSSMDCTLRTWDLPSMSPIDCFLLDSACTSLTMSPTGEFLATSHVDDFGVYLWSNRSLYTHISLRPLPANFEPGLMELPAVLLSSSGLEVGDAAESADEEAVEFQSPEQIASELVTLSLLPESRWKNLTNLDLIRRRNKPKQPPRKPKAAPFFLPTVASVEGFKFVPADGATESKGEKSEESKLRQLMPVSELGRMLLDAEQNQKYDDILAKFKILGPSHIDLEVRSLAPEGGGSIDLMLAFLHFVRHVLETNRDFELAQAYLGLFLKLHGDLIKSEKVLADELRDISEVQRTAWDGLSRTFKECLCLISYLKNATL